MSDLPATVWLNIYKPSYGPCGTAWPTRKEADYHASVYRLACIEVRVSDNAIVPPGRECEGFQP